MHPTIDFKHIDINIIIQNGNLMITTDALPVASGKGRLITLWILSGLVALAFIAAGASKLAGAAAMVEVFNKVGFGQWFRYFTGILEVTAGIGLLISRYAFYAAVLLAIVMVGAIIAHVTVLGSPPAAPVMLFVLSGIIAYLRRPQNINQQRTRT
jgi:putative oxidoreductase